VSPVSGKTDPKGDVYVLSRYLNGRPYKATPTANAGSKDADFFYDVGVYDLYPSMKAHYLARTAQQRNHIADVKAWAVYSLDTLDSGAFLPTHKREALPLVLAAMYDAGPTGLTRPEICRRLGRDGGKISGIMTDLHAAKIIYPLEGVRR